MHFATVASAALLGLGAVEGAALVARGPACTRDACGDAFTMAPGLPRQQSISSFCSDFLTDTTTTTITTTQEIPGATATVYAPTTATYTSTYYPCPVPARKREILEEPMAITQTTHAPATKQPRAATLTTPSWASQCTATANGRETVTSEARLSSACSCASFTARTSTMTITTTTTVQDPDVTTTVTPTVTTTYTNMWHPSPTLLTRNTGFEDGMFAWMFKSSDAWAIPHITSPGFNDTTPDNSSQALQMSISAHNTLASVTASQSIPAPVYNYVYSLNFDVMPLLNKERTCTLTASIGTPANNGYAQVWQLNGASTNQWDHVTWFYEFHQSSGGIPPAYLNLAFECQWYRTPAIKDGELYGSVIVDNIIWQAEVCHP